MPREKRGKSEPGNTARPGARPGSGPAARRRLTREDWARAALTAIGKGGLAAVAVEPLAARLNTTKGSFYWHFPNREALVEAALQLWEAEHTEAIIAMVDTEPDPELRLRRLFTAVTTVASQDSIEVALLATAAHPLVAPVLGRVTERRIGYTAQLYEELGSPPALARQRALLAFTTWLGYLQLAHAAPQMLPAGPEQRRYLDHMLGTLLPG